MESKKINQLATELAPELSDLTIIGDPTTGISKKITLSQMASLFTGTVEEYANLASFPLVGAADTIYIALDTNIIYRWNTSTSAYVELSPNIVTSLVFNDANGFDGTISLVGSTATLTITTALTQGSVPFIGASGALTQDNAKLFWDNTNKWLGIGTNSPSTPLDVHTTFNVGMSINNTTTNNSLLMFANQNVSKWRLGNVYSSGANYFGIYDITNSLYRFTILNSGEVGIGITNPTTKLHIDGGSSALIANLDADVSISKSLSFRSDNSARINLEVSGTESGSNVGADFFIRRYSDAGALIDTPLTITRSTGYSRFANKLFVSSAGNAPSLTWSGINDLAITNDLYASQALITNNNTLGNYSTHSIGKTRGTLASPTAVANGEIVGNVLFFGHDGTNYISGNEIVATVDGTVASGIVPLSMKFRTRNASGTMADRLVLSANGNFGVGAAANERFGVTGTGGTTGFVRYTDGATAGLFFGVNSGDAFIHSNNSTLIFGASGSNTLTEKLRITNTGSLKFSDGTLSGTGGFEITSEAFFGARFQANAYRFMGGNNSTEFLRIESGGETRIIGQGSSNTALSIYDTTARRVFCIPSQYYGYILAVSVASNGGKAISIGNAGGASEVGSIVANASSTTYNTTSDYRLKEDFKDFDGLNIMSKIKFYDFKWKVDEERTTGVIAHELQEIVPYAVNGEKDGIGVDGEPSYQGVDYSKLVAIQGRAIQQLQAQIEELKALINK